MDRGPKEEEKENEEWIELKTSASVKVFRNYPNTNTIGWSLHACVQ